MSDYKWIQDDRKPEPGVKSWGIRSKTFPIPIIRRTGRKWDWSLMWEWNTEAFRPARTRKDAERLVVEAVSRFGWKPA